jgi:hypothetical protein
MSIRFIPGLVIRLQLGRSRNECTTINRDDRPNLSASQNRQMLRVQAQPGTYPVIHSPALLDNHKHAPATSSALPIRCMGRFPAMSFSNASRVAAIIFERNGPHARVFTVMDGPTFAARWRESLDIRFRFGFTMSIKSRSTCTVYQGCDKGETYWCKAALLAE